METSLVHHVICAIWVLIRVSQLVIDISIRSSCTLWNSWSIGHPYVSEWLRHISLRMGCWRWFTCIIIWISQKVSMMAATLSACHLSWHHRGGILVLNGMFSSLHFLIFNEIFMSPRSMMDIWIISSMVRWLNLILQLFIAHRNHWSWSIITILLTSRNIWRISISLTTNEHNIALIDSCVVWGAMRSLFVISS